MQFSVNWRENRSSITVASESHKHEIACLESRGQDCKGKRLPQPGPQGRSHLLGHTLSSDFSSRVTFPFILNQFRSLWLCNCSYRLWQTSLALASKTTQRSKARSIIIKHCSELAYRIECKVHNILFFFKRYYTAFLIKEVWLKIIWSLDLHLQQ